MACSKGPAASLSCMDGGVCMAGEVGEEGERALGCFPGTRMCGWVLGLCRSTPSPGADPMRGAGCLARARLQVNPSGSSFHTQKPTSPNPGNQSKLRSAPWATLLLPGLQQEPPQCFLPAAAAAPEHGCCLHRPLNHLSPTSSTTASSPCLPPPFHFCRRESKQRGGCTQGVTHRTPGHAGA